MAYQKLQTERAIKVVPYLAITSYRGIPDPARFKV